MPPVVNNFNESSMIDTLLKNLREKIDLSIEKFFNNTYTPPINNPEIQEFYKKTIEYVLRKGKRIRPIYFILGVYLYNNGNSDIYNEDIINASIFLEILHAFFLCHDDIIDNSDLRRGEESLHKSLNKLIKKDNHKFGKNFAIISGDVLFALTCKALNNINFVNDKIKKEFLNIFYDYILDTTIGQVSDMINGYKAIEKVDKDLINKTYIFKTAKYTFESPLILGAKLANASKNEMKKLKEYAIQTGIAFQIQDDYIGLYGTIEDIGKPVTSDILEGKKTLLLMDTIENLEGKNKEKFIKLFNHSSITSENFVKIKNLISESGAKEKSLSEIENLLENSKKIISNLAIHNEKKKLLFNITEILLSKYKTIH